MFTWPGPDFHTGATEVFPVSSCGTKYRNLVPRVTSWLALGEQATLEKSENVGLPVGKPISELT